MEFLGFDTETINGKCRLIGFSNNHHLKIRNEKDVIKFLNEYKTGINLVSFNADYDIQSLLTYFPLVVKRRILYGILTWIKLEDISFPLTYIHKKYMKFGKSYIFDVMQFYSGSLKTAAEKYLGKTKHDVDASKINEKNIYTEKTINYCINDAVLAKELMVHFIKDIPESLKEVKPISPAFYSGSYFLKELENNKIEAPINSIFRKAYHGGRFEVYKRGYFKKVYYYDLNSAYPFEISRLKTLEGSEFDSRLEYIPESSYSVYLIECIVKDKFISPLVYKHKNLVTYPIGYFKGYVTKREFESVLKYNPKILGALHLYCKEKFPFKDKVDFMYMKKSESQYRLVYKTLLNSLYGRTAISIKKWKKDIGNDDIIDLYKDEKTGELFYKVEDSFNSNFVYASEITAGTRLKMYEVVNKYRNDIITVQTDGIVSLVPLDLPISEKLGEWKSETWNDLYMIGSGVYFYSDAEGLKGKFRGFSITEEKIKLILDKILRSPSSVIEFDTKKHYSITECLRIKDESKENVIMNVTRKLNLNFDRKRTWFREWENGKDILNEPISSSGLLNIILDKVKTIKL